MILSAPMTPMMCYTPITYQFLNFTISNNPSELNNAANHFCSPNLRNRQH